MERINFWKNKNVFITGADGFIGGWLTKYLVELKSNVYVIVRDLKTKNALDIHDLKNKVTIIQGDITDFQLIKRILNEYKIDTIFHLAAQALVEIANKSPLSTFESNIKGTWTILEATRELRNIPRIIVASSDKAYGEQKNLPYTEDQKLNGLYPYDASKACADIISRSYSKSYNLPIAVTRNANTYGGGDLNKKRIIPDTIISILKGDDLIIRSDGTPERDYMYIKDAVDCYLTLAENLDKEEIKGNAFNFGTQTPVSVMDVVKEIINISGIYIKPRIEGKATNEIDRQYLCIEKVKKLLKWEPKYSLKQGLKETYEWYKENLEKV